MIKIVFLIEQLQWNSIFYSKIQTSQRCVAKPSFKLKLKSLFEDRLMVTFAWNKFKANLRIV